MKRFNPPIHPGRLLTLVASITLALGCAVESQQMPGEHSEEDSRGGGKADHQLFGSCEDSCGTQSADGNCWCDDLCESFGDCCDDIVEQCEAECEVDDDCKELLCPLGGGLHEVCVDAQCVLEATVLDCPGVECAGDDDCKELQCPFGGGLHEVCEDFQCTLDATVLDCPGVECEVDDDCKELQCPLGGGLHEVCEDFKCELNATIFDCPGVECETDDDCRELECPGGGFAHELCEDFQCHMPEDACA